MHWRDKHFEAQAKGGSPVREPPFDKVKLDFLEVHAAHVATGHCRC
jgi:hypothetical protein